MTNNDKLSYYLDMFAKALIINNFKDIFNITIYKLAAMYLITEFDRDRLPDWIDQLANLNLEFLSDVKKEIIRNMNINEEEND